MIRTLVVVAGCTLTSVLAQEAEDYKARPLPGHKNAQTYTQFNNARRSFIRARLLDYYRKHGSRNAAWNDGVEVLLRDWAEVVFEKGKAWTERCKKMNAAIARLDEAKCNDPLYDYVASRVLFFYRKRDEGIARAERALRGFDKLGFPPICSFWASRAIWTAENEAKNKEKAAKWWKLLPKLLGRAAAQADYKNGMQRFWAVELDSVRIENEVAVGRTMLAEMGKGSGADPWCRQLAEGIHCITLAWAARGDGWASEVKEAGWKEYHKQLEKAGDALFAAQKLHPEFPEAGAHMITVVIGMGGELPMARQWFDASVAAQFDYKPAYLKLLWALKPRWGGSYEQMLAFGRECLATNRYDTLVPDYFYNALFDAINEEGKWQHIWRMRGVFRDWQRFMAGILTRPVWTEKQKHYWNSTIVVAGYASGHRKDATKVFAKLGKNFDKTAFQIVPKLDSAKVIAYFEKKLAAQKAKAADDKK